MSRPTKFINAILALMVSFAVNSFAGELPAQLANKEFLGSLDWKDKKAIGNITNGWNIYKGEQGEGSAEGIEGKLILKETVVEIDGISFKGTTRRYLDTAKYEIIYTAGPGDYEATPQNLDYCNRQVNKLSTSFGNPKNLSDLSGQTSNELATIDIKAQWDINNTRVVIWCFATKVYDGFIPLISIMYGHKDSIVQVLDAIHLRCTRKSKRTGLSNDNNVTEEPPFTLIINQNIKTLTSKGLNLGKTIVYDDKKIITSMVSDEHSVKADFSLDRYTGSYVWVMEITKDGVPEGYGKKQWGDCEQYIAEKKF